MPVGRDREKKNRNNVPSTNGEQGITQEKDADRVQWKLTTPKYSMSDLILQKSTERELMDVISFFKNKDILFHEWGFSEKYSDRDGLAINLYGEPGTGKTMAAHAISAAINLPMICVDYAEIESKYVGETSKNLVSLFQSAQNQDAIIFFDEADALLSKRVTNMTSATDVSVNQTRSVLLTLLNDYRGIIIFATNFIQNFDAAFLRRIRYHICFHLPDCDQRERLWRSYIPSKMPASVDFPELAKKYAGISGSDIANAVFSAAVSAANKREESVNQSYFEQAILSIISVKEANQQNHNIVDVKRRVLTDEEVSIKELEGKQ